MTIAWNDNPPETPRRAQMPLRRIEPGKPVAGVITTPKLIGMDCHYINGRTLPHTQEECPGCSTSRRKFWEGYIALWTRSPSTHIIVALTAAAANELLDAAPDSENLRGIVCTLARANAKPNSRLTCQIEEKIFPDSSMPPIPELRSHLWHIWGLDQATITDDHPLYRALLATRFEPAKTDGI